jgi:hypothetical protein
MCFPSVMEKHRITIRKSGCQRLARLSTRGLVEVLDGESPCCKEIGGSPPRAFERSVTASLSWPSTLPLICHSPDTQNPLFLSPRFEK